MLSDLIQIHIGIYWDKLSPEKLGQIKILRELKSQIEQETGEKLPSGPSEKLPQQPKEKDDDSFGYFFCNPGDNKSIMWENEVVYLFSSLYM